jgi:hypothetical protein
MDSGGAGALEWGRRPDGAEPARSRAGGAWPSGGEEMTMTDPWTVLSGLAVVALAFVVAPVAGSVYVRLRAPRWLRCPETSMPAAVAVDARHAAWTAVWSRPLLRVRSCTLWPWQAGCAQRCCALPEISDGATRPRPEPVP